jgi:DNA-binding LytR/AlgR family response regulator
MNIAVCDRAEADRKALCRILKSIFAEREEELKLQEYAGGEKLLADHKKRTKMYDLIFWDIPEQGAEELETAKKLRETGCRSILALTAHSPAYAIEGYEAAPAAYLLKPMDEERVKTLIVRMHTPQWRECEARKWNWGS